MRRARNGSYARGLYANSAFRQAASQNDPAGIDELTQSVWRARIPGRGARTPGRPDSGQPGPGLLLTSGPAERLTVPGPWLERSGLGQLVPAVSAKLGEDVLERQRQPIAEGRESESVRLTWFVIRVLAHDDGLNRVERRELERGELLARWRVDLDAGLPPALDELIDDF